MQKVIDIHCHLFNLKYLPVAGILRRYSNNRIPHLVARGVEWLLIKNTETSYCAKKIEFAAYIKPKYNDRLYKYLGEKQFSFLMKNIFDFDPANTVTAIEQMAFVGDILTGELSIALDEFEKMEQNEAKAFLKKEFANEDEQIKYKAGLLRRMLNWIIKNFTALVNYLKWFVFMTHSEEALYDYLKTKDEIGVEKFLYLMMDVDHFFNNPTTPLKYSSYFDFEKEQISNMKQLHLNHGDAIGFVAFNPARDNYMEIIKKAIEEKGFKGIKFYPPMGYRADGDAIYNVQIETLFQYCTAKRIPLFTHCNNGGFEALPGNGHSGYNSNPVYWEAALQKHPDLILCLGHAGGSEGWFCANKPTDEVSRDEILGSAIQDDSKLQQADWNKSYAAMVFKLCVKYHNVYCDASYLDDMVNSDGSFNVIPKQNFKERLLKLFAAEPGFSKKIMYGSDWHMLYQEAKNNVYLDSYIKLFSEKELTPFRDDFFYHNAVAFLNL